MADAAIATSAAVEILDSSAHERRYLTPLEKARELSLWQGEICKRCGRRNCVGFEIEDATWRAVTRGRWNVLCTTCFDEEAEAAGVRYHFGRVWPVSWSDWAPTAPESEAACL